MNASFQNSSSIPQDPILHLVDCIRQTAFEIHKFFGKGFLEKVYENALCHRLQKQGMEVQQQVKIGVYDEDGYQVGDYTADLIVSNEIIVELKAANCLANEHQAQLLNYLKATKIHHGVLINFGAEKFQIRKFIL